jgi:hypothetical protein
MSASQSVSNKSASGEDARKNKDEVALDSESFDLGDEYITVPTESERAAKKVAARKKIELYWEKKRLQEQLGDFSDEDLDF